MVFENNSFVLSHFLSWASISCRLYSPYEHQFSFQKYIRLISKHKLKHDAKLQTIKTTKFLSAQRHKAKLRSVPKTNTFLFVFQTTTAISTITTSLSNFYFKLKQTSNKHCYVFQTTTTITTTLTTFSEKTFCFCFLDNNDDNDNTVDDDGLLRLGQQPNGRLREKKESYFR